MCSVRQARLTKPLILAPVHLTIVTVLLSVSSYQVAQPWISREQLKATRSRKERISHAEAGSKPGKEDLYRKAARGVSWGYV